MNTESAIDLSVKSRSSSESEPDKIDSSSIVRPIPRPPWSIIWYQSLWPSFGHAPLQNPLNRSYDTRYDNNISNQGNDQLNKDLARTTWRRKYDIQNRASPANSITNKNHHEPKSQGEEDDDDEIGNLQEEDEVKQYEENSIKEGEENHVATIIDIACCDGPIRFERISNPNFALTVEHQNEPMGSTTSSTTITEPCRNPTTKTYVCIYCSQSFKSLFCYQKHKKRHLNPVSVDITGTNINTPMVYPPENSTNTKDLNVQFFPCKKCGCKFPSYYFVHKHKKTCH